MSKYLAFEPRFYSTYWGPPPNSRILTNIEGSIKQKLRKPIFSKSIRKEINSRKTFFEKAMLFQTVSLDSLPKPLDLLWVPDILNDIHPTIMEYFDILPSHSIPVMEGNNLSFTKSVIRNIRNTFLHITIRLRLWFSKEHILSSEEAKKLFENLLQFISTYQSSQLEELCSLSLVPHLKKLYFSNGTITHWTICKHVIEPYIRSIRIIRVSKDIQFLQIIYQFTTNQAFVKYNAGGSVLIGNNVNITTVKDFIVFEKMLNFPYSSWKIMDRIGGFNKSLCGFKSNMQSDYTVARHVLSSN